MSLFMALALAADPTPEQQRCLDLTFLPTVGNPVRLDDITRANRKSEPRASIIVWPSASMLPPGTTPDRLREVELSYTLLPIGRAANCRIVRSSGNATVDAQSCTLAVRQVRSFPAMVDGDPVRSEARLTFRWEPGERDSPLARCEDDGGTLPIEPRAWAPSGEVAGRRALRRNVNTLIRLSFGGGGRARACEVVASNAPEAIADQVCRAAIRNAAVLPAVNAKGDAVPATVIRLVRTRVKPDYATLPLVTD